MSGPGLQGGKDDGDRDECRELERECPGGVHLETGAELEVDGIAESDGDRRGRDATGQDDRADDTDRGGRDCFARLLLQGCARRTGFSVAASTILTDAIPEVQSGAQGSRAQPARPFYPWLTFDYG